MSKRIFCVFLCLSLCAGFLILPAAASSIGDDGVNDAGTQYINYLTEQRYEVLLDVWDNVDQPEYLYQDVNRFAFKWYPANFVTGSYMLFAIQADRMPSAISVRFDKGSYVAATYEGAIPSAGNLYFYRINMPSNPERIEIYGRYDSAYTGLVRVASCFGVRNMLSVYDRAEFTYVPILRQTEGEFVEGTYNEGVKFFPYTAPSWLGSEAHLERVDYTIRCDGDRFNTSAVGKVKLLFTTVADSITVTASLVGKDQNVRDVHSIKVNLQKDSAWGLVNNYEVGIGVAYNYAAYEADFDLTGYDMSNYDLQLYVSVSSVPFVSTGSVGEPEIFVFSFRSIQYVPTVISNPWYKPITDVINFLAGEVRNVVISVEGLLNDSLNWWDELFVKLESYFGSSDDQSNAVNNSIQNNTQQQEQVQDQGDQMKDQIEEIEKAEDEMLQVPEIDPGDLELGTLIPSDGLTMMTNVMVTMTNNNYVGQIMLLVASVALIGVMIL